MSGMRARLSTSLTRFPPERRRRLLFLLGIMVTAVVAALIFFTGGDRVSTDNAYLKASRVTVSAEVSGRVTRVHVGENQRVEQGSALFEVDSEPYRIAVAQAEADLVDSRNAIFSIQARYRESEARLRRAQEDQAFAERELNRELQLAKSRVISESQLDAAQHAQQQARQTVEAIEQERSALLAELGGNANMPAVQHPRYLAARAALDRARLDLSRTNVVAPAGGLVSQLDRFRPGDYVQPGVPLFSLVEIDRPWVEANLKETELGAVRTGQPVTIEVDAYPGVELAGRVESVGAATGAEFSVLPPQNASGNWIKVTQRIPVRISLLPQDDLPPLRMGMSATVTIHTSTDGVQEQDNGVAGAPRQSPGREP